MDFNTPFVTGKEREYIEQVFQNMSFAGNGLFTKRVNEWLEDYFQAHRVLLTHSCTGALEMSAMLCDLGPGDEFITPSFTFVTTASSMMRGGATPVFCEIDPNTLLMDIDDVREKITDKTKAIVPVHYAGSAPDMEELRKLSMENSIALIEDSAQGMGAKWNGKKLGTFGRLGCVSFHETKNIHCGLGGCLIVNDPELVERAEIIWERGTDRSAFFRGLVDKYTWREVGSSFYPTEFQAAFLLAQLESLERNMTKRREIWGYYHELLSPIEEEGGFRILRPSIGSEQNFHMFSIILNSAEEADSVRIGLGDSGINAVIHYVPLHESTVGSKFFQGSGLKITSNLSRRLIRLPFHNSLTKKEIEKIPEILRRILNLPR